MGYNFALSQLILLMMYTADLRNEVRNFGAACANLTDTMDTLRKESEHSQKLSTIRMVMDRVMNIERTFILPEGIPGTPFFKYVG